MAPLAKNLEGRDITPRLADSRRAQRDAAQNRTAWLRLSMNIAHMYAWRWDRARAAFEFAVAEGVRGAAVTPYLLQAVQIATAGRSLETNLALLEANASLAGEISAALAVGEAPR